MQKKDPLEEIIGGLFKGIGKSFKYAFFGIKKLNKPVPLTFFILSILVSVLSVLKRDSFLSTTSLFDTSVPKPIIFLFFGIAVFLPFLTLAMLGTLATKELNEYDKAFADVGFIGKDKKYPIKIWQKAEGKKTIFCFKSNIPLPEWKKAKDRLEIALDCTVRVIRASVGTKKAIELVTVPSDYIIPDNIPWNDSYISDKDGVVVLGESDIEMITNDFNSSPHALVAGETGGGKSVAIRCILWQFIFKGARVYMFDFKGGIEFGKRYEQYGNVVTDRKKALTVLKMLVRENQARMELFRELEVKKLSEYNQTADFKLCRIGIFIDELAEMMDKSGVDKETKEIIEEISGALSSLARLARATGINLILGTQRPDATVVTGQIKTNVTARICGRFADPAPSEIVLNSTAAADLPEVKGRFLYKYGNELKEFQAFWFDDDKALHPVESPEGGLLTEGKKRYTENTEKKTFAEQEQQQEKSKEIELDFDFD